VGSEPGGDPGLDIVTRICGSLSITREQFTGLRIAVGELALTAAGSSAGCGWVCVHNFDVSDGRAQGHNDAVLCYNRRYSRLIHEQTRDHRRD